MRTEAGSRSEQMVEKIYTIPAGKMVYQPTLRGGLWPGNVLKEFNAKRIGFSKRFKMSKFIAESEATLFYRNKRTLHKDSGFLTTMDRLQEVRPQK